MAGPAFKGGNGLRKRLDEIGTRAQNAKSVRAGFLENATYPDGRSVAANAIVQEFGATIQRDAGDITVYRKTDKTQSYFLRKGRFVKKTQSNFASTHHHEAYTITIPPRPFFRNAIRKYGPQWGADLGKLLKATAMDAERALALMGERMKGQIQQSILDLFSPPLAKSTIVRKGFDKPLIESAHMLNSVDSEVIK